MAGTSSDASPDASPDATPDASPNASTGVLVVGTMSYLVSDWFPDKTVWSHYGQGYGFLPLVLPFLGLWWLWASRRSADAPTT